MTVLSVNSPRLAAPLLPRPHRVIHSFKKAYSAYKILIAGSELPYTRFPIIIRESQPAARDSTEKPRCYLVRKAVKSRLVYSAAFVVAARSFLIYREEPANTASNAVLT